MATTTVDIGTLITRREGVKGGRPIIASTGTSVLAIVWLYEQGISAEDIHRDHFPHLPLEGIFAALAYWVANRSEIDGYMREDLEAEHEGLAEKAKLGR
jgi:uncharacterized protein (DUF433 family)